MTEAVRPVLIMRPAAESWVELGGQGIDAQQYKVRIAECMQFVAGYSERFERSAGVLGAIPDAEKLGQNCLVAIGPLDLHELHSVPSTSRSAATSPADAGRSNEHLLLKCSEVMLALPLNFLSK